MPVRSLPAFLVLAGLQVCVTLPLAAQMVSPKIDRDQGPFSYFSKPTDLIGVMNAPGGTEITPEGYLYTGYGELMFFSGPEQTPLAARVRTLEKGYLPIVHYGVTTEGIDYRFAAFAAQIPAPLRKDTEPTGQIANFVRVTLQNPGTTSRTAILTTAIRYEGEQTTAEPLPDNRFRRPAEPDRIGDYRQLGEPFKPDWAYSMEAGNCLRDDRVLFHYPSTPEPQLQLTLRTHYNRVQPLSNDKLHLTPTTPVCSLRYTVPLAPGESREIDLVMPLVPAQKGSVEASNLANANFESAHKGVVDFWEQELARGMQIELPEGKPIEAFKTNLIYDLLSRNLIQGKSVQAAGQFQYHRFYLRDSADYVRMYDVTGYPEIAGQVLDFFLDRQMPDGNFLSQPNQYDGWGEAMWTFGEHFRMTHDLDYARRVYPAMVKAVAWLHAARIKDPMHLVPATDVRDNEYVSGHLTGYNFLALDGLQAAIDFAKVLGKTDDQVRFEAELKDYRAVFFPLLDKVSTEQGGTLPPSLDAAGEWKGTDWGNLLSVTPEPLLDPFDPRVTATLKKTQAHYQEGISTYAEPDDGIFLHHYLTIKNTLTELVRGEQEQAMREFYALLLHTSSTHAGFEYAIRPWGNRDFLGNLSPHAWFSADYRNLMRNMLVREEGDKLHLLSAISPEWVGAGKTIKVTGAPSTFGTMDFALTSTSADSAVLSLKSAFPHPPAEIIVHVPWFLLVTEATLDGHVVKVQKDGLHLPATAHELHLRWKPISTPHMNYDRTVESFKAEYSRRFDRLMTEGKMSEGPDTWQVPE
jgi:hypothetical protein